MLNLNRLKLLDGKSEYSLIECNQALYTTLSSSHCSSHWENAIKITCKWYMTPVKLNCMFQDTPMVCWHQCVQKGDLHHILWTCNAIRNYWESVFALISHITGTGTRPCQILALFGMRLDRFPKQFLMIVTHILIAA